MAEGYILSIYQESDTWWIFSVCISLLFFMLSECVELDNFAIKIKAFGHFNNVFLFEELINPKQALLRLDKFSFEPLHT